jgi:hypothetical protein
MSFDIVFDMSLSNAEILACHAPFGGAERRGEIILGHSHTNSRLFRKMIICATYGRFVLTSDFLFIWCN